jgi:hypothetical protein
MKLFTRRSMVGAGQTAVCSAAEAAGLRLNRRGVIAGAIGLGKRGV